MILGLETGRGGNTPTCIYTGTEGTLKCNGFIRQSNDLTN